MKPFYMKLAKAPLCEDLLEDLESLGYRMSRPVSALSWNYIMSEECGTLYLTDSTPSNAVKCRSVQEVKNLNVPSVPLEVSSASLEALRKLPTEAVMLLLSEQDLLKLYKHIREPI